MATPIRHEILQQFADAGVDVPESIDDDTLNQMSLAYFGINNQIINGVEVMPIYAPDDLPPGISPITIS